MDKKKNHNPARKTLPCRRARHIKQVCFVISPIGPQGSPIRRRSDWVLENIIEPAVKQCGYTPLRADKMSDAGKITKQVIKQLIEAPLVVADLTDHNPNVFYELAIRHALRKPLVQLIKKGETVPFDVREMRTIDIDRRAPQRTSDQIVEQVNSFDASPLETPVFGLLPFRDFAAPRVVPRDLSGEWVSLYRPYKLEGDDNKRKWREEKVRIECNGFEVRLESLDNPDPQGDYRAFGHFVHDGLLVGDYDYTGRGALGTGAFMLTREFRGNFLHGYYSSQRPGGARSYVAWVLVKNDGNLKKNVREAKRQLAEATTPVVR